MCLSFLSDQYFYMNSNPRSTAKAKTKCKRGTVGSSHYKWRPVHWNYTPADSAAPNAASGQGGLNPTYEQYNANDLPGSNQRDPGRWLILTRRDLQDVRAYMKEEGPIGHGSFGAVRSVLIKIHDQPIERLALKAAVPGEEHLAFREAEIMLQLYHPNCCLLKYYYEENDCLHVLLEMMDEGDLKHLIHNIWDSTVGLGVYCELFTYQIFRGLNYMHSLGIAHRDVKPANVLISRATGYAKLADFNCAANMAQKEKHSPHVGTRQYHAPELCLESRHYDFKVDVWSAGVVLTDMILSRSIFLINKPAKRKNILPFIIEYLGPPTEDDFNQMQVSQENREKCLKTKYIRHHMHNVIGNNPPGISDRHHLYALLPCIFTYKIGRRYSAYEVCSHSLFDYIRSGQARLENGYNLPDVFDLPYA